jgi:hypothetical protein
VSIQTNSASPISCIKRLGGVGIMVILMCLYKQIRSTSPIISIKHHRGVGIKVILMCLCKKIVLVSTALLNALVVWG